MSRFAWVSDALEVAKDVFEIGTAIVDAVRSEDRERVDRILSAELKTSVAKAKAYARAAERFESDA